MGKKGKTAKCDEPKAAAQDLVKLGEDGEIDFEEVLRPTRFKKYKIDY